VSLPLLGREQELAGLVAAIAADRSIVLVGEAGIGKTALARAAAAASGRPLHEGGAFATLSWRPYFPLERALGRGLSGDPARVAEEVEAAVGPDLLFLDDLHWADEQTLATIALLLGRILVVAAVRSGDAGAMRALEVVREAGGSRFEIEPLAADAARAMAQAHRPDLGDHGLDELLRRAAGNPLLLEELATMGSPSRALALALTGRVDRLSPAARGAIELLAIADRPVAAARLDSTVDEAAALGLVETDQGAIRIRHDLVAEAIRARLTPVDRQRLHLRAAAIVDEPADIAHHLAAGGRRKEAAELALASISALEAGPEGGDPRAQAALLVVAAEASEPAQSLELRVRAARALDEVADWAAVARVLRPTGEEGPVDLLTERDAILAHAEFALGDFAGSLRRLAVAATRPVEPVSDAAVRLAIEAATMRVNAEGAIAEAIALLDRKLALAGLGPDPRRDLEVLRASIQLLVAPADADVVTIHAAANEAFASGRFRTATDRARVVQYLLVMGVGAEPAMAYLLEQSARFDARGLPTFAVEFRADAVLAAYLAAQYERAVGLADEVLERPSVRRAWQTAAIFRARALTHLGRFDDAEAGLEALRLTVSRDFLGLGETYAAEAELAFWNGRPRAARELAEASLAIAPPIPVGHVIPRLIRAWADFELGATPEAELDIPLTPSLAGTIPELTGLAAAHSGDYLTAAAAFDGAAAAWQDFERPRALTCRWAAAEMRRLAGDRDAAIDGLRVALDAATASGFEPLAARIRRSLRQAGVRVSVRTGARGGALGLTQREREVVDLVDRGFTNMEIARRLGLGRPTVTRILESAMAKLGAERRTQLAGMSREV
jgi:DNA-binding CsgD family transcriptional regulator